MHDDWDTRPLKVSSFTESVSDVVDARSQYQRGPPWVNQFTKVSSCNSLADFNLLPKSVSVATAVPSVFSTPTGLVKALPTSTSSYPYGPPTQCHQKQPKTPMGYRWCPKAQRTPWSYFPRKEIPWCWQGYAIQDSRWLPPRFMEETKHFGSSQIQM